MNKPLSVEELSRASVPFPLHTMTKREKLLRFAAIIRSAKREFYIFHGLEHEPDWILRVLSNQNSAFHAAAADPILRDAGLTGVSVLDAKEFFDLSTKELHEFSCDCGGHISNDEMANRVEGIATA